MSNEPGNALATETGPVSPSSRPVTVLLVDDQAIVGAAVRRMLQPEEGIVFHHCSDPTKAIETAESVEPTVILQDLVMPGVDGLDLVTKYRETASTRDVPIVVLSTREEPETKAEAFARGANDYIVKLPDRLELVARVRYHSKGYVALLERNEATRQLMAELAEASQYVKSLLPPPLEEPRVRIDWRFLTSTSLGGDAFGYGWIDDDHLQLYLLDVCGHGVGAALLSVTVMNVIRSQALPGADFRKPDEVLSALNEAFPMAKQNGSYFTIWYGVYRPSTRTLVHASGGHPAALLLEGPAGTAPAARLRAPNLIIGFVPGKTFRSQEVAVPPGARLFLYSDGVYEVEMADGQIWPFDDFAAFMEAPPAPGASRMDELLAQARRLNRSDALPDDFSILEAVFP
ncbi:MAG TPA: SpoIIE family protein phosphatase [Thermoanaerobaculia bacterium]|nr:SpoIIE family protein phosphatase [Thermoanaerobaculia bacterium]